VKNLRLVGEGWLEIETAHESLGLKLTGENGTFYRFPGVQRK
jgi:hypothetical protein